MNDDTMRDFALSESPYPGLRAFNHTEADIFFGREEQSDQLLEKLGHTRFISVVGLSGCGKSSLVRAGLIPNLESGFLVEAGPYWRIATMCPGNSPMRHLAEALLECRFVETGKKGDLGDDALPFLLAALRRGPLGLVEALQDTPLPAHTNLLIVVDQFEELFRHHREGGSDETEAFVNLLLNSAGQEQMPIYVVTTMRSEYIGDCALFHGLPEVLNKGQFLVPRLSREQQEMAIIGPAGLFGGAIDERLVNNLLNEMGSDPDQLPLLQHCLMRMWTRKNLQGSGGNGQPEDEITLTPEDYEAVGELKDALSNHADEAFAELDKEGQQVAEFMFRCLSERDPSHRNIRRPVSLGEAATVAGSEAKIKEVVEVFRRADRCFLTPNARIPLTPDTVLDISHESLIRQWQRMKTWSRDEAESAAIYRSLEKRARYWKQLRHDSKWLWDSPDLDIALHWKRHEQPSPEWAVRYGDHFPLAMEFLKASADAQEEKRLREERAREEKLLQEERAREEKLLQEERAREEKLRQQERERRLQLRHTRQLLTGALIALVIAVTLAGWGFKERKNAKNAQERVVNSWHENEMISLNFQTTTDVAFGFISEQEQTLDFLLWLKAAPTISERFNSILNSLLERSKHLQENEKKEWRNKIDSGMKEGEKRELLDKLAAEAAERVRREIDIHVAVNDRKGSPIPLTHGLYSLKAGEEVRIGVEAVYNPYKLDVKFSYGTQHGTIKTTSPTGATYIAPNSPKIRDTVTISVVDKTLDKVVEQRILSIRTFK